MSDDRVTETTPTHTTTIIERRGSGAGLLIGLAVLIAVVVGAFFLFTQNPQSAKDDAITDAAKSVGAAADKIGDSAEKAVDQNK